MLLVIVIVVDCIAVIVVVVVLGIFVFVANILVNSLFLAMIAMWILIIIRWIIRLFALAILSSIISGIILIAVRSWLRESTQKAITICIKRLYVDANISCILWCFRCIFRCSSMRNWWFSIDIYSQIISIFMNIFADIIISIVNWTFLTEYLCEMMLNRQKEMSKSLMLIDNRINIIIPLILD